MEVLRWGYRIPFCRAPTLSKEPIPFPAYCPNSIRGKALEGEVCSLLEKGANRTSSSSFSRLLQPYVCGDEGLRVVETSDRPFVAEPEDFEDVLQDGDSPVGHVVGPTWRLDGVS